MRGTSSSSIGKSRMIVCGMFTMRFRQTIPGQIWFGKPSLVNNRLLGAASPAIAFSRQRTFSGSNTGVQKLLMFSQKLQTSSRRRQW